MKKFLFILLFFQQIAIHAQNELVIDDGFTIKVLGEELQVFNDESGELSLSQVLQKDFLDNKLARPNLGFSKGAIWVRTRVTNNSDSATFNLLINQPVLDTLSIFILNETDSLISSYTVGESFSKTTVHLNTKRNFRIPLTLSNGQSKNIYLRIATEEQIVLPVYIASLDGAWKLYSDSNLLFGSYF